MGFFSSLRKSLDKSKGVWVKELINSKGEPIKNISLSIENYNFEIIGFFPKSCEAQIKNCPNVLFYGLSGINVIYLYAVLNFDNEIFTPICVREVSGSGEFIEEYYIEDIETFRSAFQDIGLAKDSVNKIKKATKSVDSDYSLPPKKWYDVITYIYDN